MKGHRMWMIAVGLVALLVFWWATMPTTYRYKLTVEVETPEGLRVGSAVREVSWSKGMQLTSEASTSSMTHKGEAVIVDLPHGQMLFALMSPDGQETPMLAFGSARQTSRSDRSERVLHPPATPEADYGRSGYPRLVRFRNIDDPKTVEKVDPANLSASFGEGYRLRRVTARIVNEPITTLVRSKLSWIDRYKADRIRLSGKSGAVFISDDLSDKIGTGSFVKGAEK